MKSQEIKQLRARIRKHNDLYWNKNQPRISDAGFDTLLRRLSRLNPTDPVLTEVHQSVVGRRKVKHKTPMLSLAKAYSFEAVKERAKSVARDKHEVFSVTSKKDGLSSEFSGDKLTTRGDGTYGIDISDRIPFISNLATGRGEIVVLKSDFAGKAPRSPEGKRYKTPRSAAAGLVNNTAPVEKGLLTFVPFEIDAHHIDLEDLTAKTGHSWSLLVDNLKASDYPIDGAVISLLDREYGDSLGSTAHHPRHSIAFKFANETAVTKLVDIRWTSGKHKLTPTAILEPVELGGFTNTKASLHNWATLTRLGVRIGSTVEIERCGGIIPQVVRVIASPGATGAIGIPSCPDCGNQAILVGPDVLCEHQDCPGRLAARLHTALVRLGIEQIGPETARNLVDAGFSTVASVLGVSKSGFLRLPGVKDKLAGTYLAEIARVRSGTVKDFELIAAMNFEGVGLGIAKLLTEGRTIPEAAALFLGELEAIPGFGAARASAVWHGLRSHEFSELLGLVNVEATKASGSHKRTVCFTGKSGLPRVFWRDKATANGWQPVGSVTKALALLVTSDPGSESGKARKARKLGLTITTYSEFEKMFAK